MISDAEKQGVKIIETKKLLYIAEAAYNRGDYINALKSLEQAKLSYALETKGEFNLLYTVKNHPLETMYAIIGLIVFTFSSSLAIRLSLYKRKLKYLREEEKLLLELMKTIQRECFENNHLSMEEYREAMNQYEKRLAETINDKIIIETKLANILKLRGKKKTLAEERLRLTELIKDVQDKYLNKGTIETRIYQNMITTYTKRLFEVEEAVTFIEAQEAIRGNNFIRRLFKSKT